MRLRLCLALALAVCAGGAAMTARAGAPQSGGPVLLKRTIVVAPRRFLRFWKNPKAAEPQYDTRSWVPQIRFEVLGPVAAGSQFYAEFDAPDGKPWITYKLPTQELTADDSDQIGMPRDLSDDELEKQAVTTPAGLFPFRIKLKNALEGRDETLFSGKYRLATFTPDQSIPENKGKQEFYVGYDWALPVGYVWPDPRDDSDAPMLSFSMWFRGGLRPSDLKAYVLYKGKQFEMQTDSTPLEEVSTADGDPAYRWTHVRFVSYKLRFLENGTEVNGHPDAHLFKQNPGDYEIKVTRGTELAREAKFSVGPDGKLVDNGFASAARLGGIRHVLPVKVLGTKDGKWDAAAWKTEAFYGNPITGFTAP